MATYKWPEDPMKIVAEFEARHENPKAAALLLFAVTSVDSLYYLGDLDRALDASQATVGDHSSDVVDVAHARWATGTCITALDLAAAAMARSFCSHTGPHELHIGGFSPKGKSAHLRANLPPKAKDWIDEVLIDSDYKLLKVARNALTHARVSRHFTVPRQRLRLEVGHHRVDVPTIIDWAKRVGSKHVSLLLTILSSL